MNDHQYSMQRYQRSDCNEKICLTLQLWLCYVCNLCGKYSIYLAKIATMHNLRINFEGDRGFVATFWVVVRGSQFVLFMQITTFSTYKTKPNLHITSEGKENSLHNIKSVTL